MRAVPFFFPPPTSGQINYKAKFSFLSAFSEQWSSFNGKPQHSKNKIYSAFWKEAPLSINVQLPGRACICFGGGRGGQEGGFLMLLFFSVVARIFFLISACFQISGVMPHKQHNQCHSLLFSLKTHIFYSSNSFSAINLTYSVPPLDFASFLASYFCFSEHLSEFVHIIVSPCFRLYYSFFICIQELIFIHSLKSLWKAFFFLQCVLFLVKGGPHCPPIKRDFFWTGLPVFGGKFLSSRSRLVLGYIRASDSSPQHSFPNDSRGVFPQSYIKQGFFYSDIRNT